MHQICQSYLDALRKIQKGVVNFAYTSSPNDLSYIHQEICFDIFSKAEMSNFDCIVLLWCNDYHLEFDILNIGIKIQSLDSKSMLVF